MTFRLWPTTLARIGGRLRQQGHVAQSDNEKCQVDSTFQVRGNKKSECHVVAARLMTRHRVTQELRHSGSFPLVFLPLVLAQRPEFPKAEIPERRIVIGLKRTPVSGLSTPGKIKGRMNESLRIEISKFWIHEGDIDH
jgi:hypothetical protein